MTGAVRVASVIVGAAAIGLMGVLLGAWWAPFVAGIVAGVLLPRARWALLAGAVAGLVAWGVPLEAAQVQFGLGPTATSLAAIMGFTGAATIPVALTLVVGLLLGFTGAWLGSAGRSLYPTSRSLVPRRSLQRSETKSEPVPAQRP